MPARVEAAADGYYLFDVDDGMRSWCRKAGGRFRQRRGGWWFRFTRVRSAAELLDNYNTAVYAGA